MTKNLTLLYAQLHALIKTQTDNPDCPQLYKQYSAYLWIIHRNRRRRVEKEQIAFSCINNDRLFAGGTGRRMWKQ